MQPVPGVAHETVGGPGSLVRVTLSPVAKQLRFAALGGQSACFLMYQRPRSYVPDLRRTLQPRTTGASTSAVQRWTGWLILCNKL